MFVLINCNICGIKYVKVSVEDRDPNSESAVEWMKNKVTPQMGLMHSTCSPLCSSTDVDVIVPAPENPDYIGQPPDVSDDEWIKKFKEKGGVNAV